MNFTGVFVVFGTIAFLLLIAVLIRAFNKSRTTSEWFQFLLQQIGVALGFLLFFDLQLLFLLLSVLFVWGIIYYPLSWGSIHLTPFWYHLLIAISFIYFLLLLIWTGSKQFYSQFSFLNSKKKYDDEGPVETTRASSKFNNAAEQIKSLLAIGFGFLIPLMIIVALVMVAITCFSAWTGVLNNNGNISFIPVIKKDQIGRLFDFYTWHFCDLIPQIKVAETLHWEVPYKYADGGVAVLLLLFKSLMAYIVIARFYTWNKWRKEAREKKEPRPEELY